jgi:tRNA U34 5-methylaminomethyl-2-thiouridine-forming methyltransferase MnmC
VDQSDKPHIIITGDGSPSLQIDSIDETYHSIHGALSESTHVFIQAGLEYVLTNKSQLHILEVGLGTALNAALTADYSISHPIEIEYTGLENHPLSEERILELKENWNGHQTISEWQQKILLASWNTSIGLSDRFILNKYSISIQDISLLPNSIDLVYYDAFAPRVQPEMWTLEIFQKLFLALKPNGILVTYCAKGQVRRDLQSAGFFVERLFGPPPKREMLRGVKTKL